ncbi:MAG: hypothetical protein ACREQA_04290 [Candidatus Binatia bacterium]
MVPIAEKKTYPICPFCNWTDFYIDGVVLHRQPYDAKANDYGVSKMEWDEDYPREAHCADCDRDVTKLFKKLEVLTFYAARFRKR